jgi:hypothetical protein
MTRVAQRLAENAAANEMIPCAFSIMDKVTIVDHLHKAEDHDREGSVHVENQKSMVLDLEADGYDATQARELLASFEELLALRRADRDRLWTELQAAEADGRGS